MALRLVQIQVGPVEQARGEDERDRVKLKMWPLQTLE